MDISLLISIATFIVILTLRLQLAAYAAALGDHAMVGNAYISTKEPGKFVLFTWADWQADYRAFMHLVAYWQHMHGWVPEDARLPF